MKEKMTGLLLFSFDARFFLFSRSFSCSLSLALNNMRITLGRPPCSCRLYIHAWLSNVRRNRFSKTYVCDCTKQTDRHIRISYIVHSVSSCFSSIDQLRLKHKKKEKEISTSELKTIFAHLIFRFFVRCLIQYFILIITIDRTPTKNPFSQR